MDRNVLGQKAGSFLKRLGAYKFVLIVIAVIIRVIVRIIKIIVIAHRSRIGRLSVIVIISVVEIIVVVPVIVVIVPDVLAGRFDRVNVLERQKPKVALTFELHTSPSAALVDQVAHKPTLPLNTGLDAIPRAHSQDCDRPPIDVVVGVEDGRFELTERQRRPHSETLQDVALHNRPDLLDWR